MGFLFTKGQPNNVQAETEESSSNKNRDRLCLLGDNARPCVYSPPDTSLYKIAARTAPDSVRMQQHFV
jgi:hypothetical protein